MHELVTTPDDLRDQVAAIESSDDEKWILDQVTDALGLTQRGIIIAAAGVKRLVDMGVDIGAKGVSQPIVDTLLRVAHGQVLPDVPVKFLGKPALMRKTCGLTIPDQRRVVDDDPIKVMTPDGDHRLVKTSKMSDREMSQVFNRSHIRNESEQISWLNDQALKQKAREPQGPVVKLDKKRGGIWVDDAFVPSRDMVRYLAELLPHKRESARR